MTLVVIGLGGAAGAISRHLLGEWVQSLAGEALPWGTLAVNVVGSFLLGFVMVLLQASATSSEVRYFVTIGFLSSFTTFSTFSYETSQLLRTGEWWRAGGYVAGSMVLGLAAVATGILLAGMVTQRT